MGYHCECYLDGYARGRKIRRATASRVLASWWRKSPTLDRPILQGIRDGISGRAIGSSADLDTLTQLYSAFESFQELLDAPGDYRPTVYMDHPQKVRLANAYDQAQSARGDARRAHRVHLPTWPKYRRDWTNQAA